MSSEKKRERTGDEKSGHEDLKRQRTPSPTRVVAKMCEHIAFQFENEEATGVCLGGEPRASKYIALFRTEDLDQALIQYLIEMKGWVSGPQALYSDTNREALLSDERCSSMLIDLVALRFMELDEIEDISDWICASETNESLIKAKHAELKEKARFYDHTEVLPACRMMRIDTWY
jgi:hypothetical protein